MDGSRLKTFFTSRNSLDRGVSEAYGLRTLRKSESRYAYSQFKVLSDPSIVTSEAQAIDNTRFQREGRLQEREGRLAGDLIRRIVKKNSVRR